MANINIDEILRRQMRLAQLEQNGIRSYIAPSLRQALADIRAILADVDNITSQRQLRQIERAIKDAIQGEQGWALLTDELQTLAERENQFMSAIVASGTVAADSEQVQQLAKNTMMILKSGDATRSGFWSDFVEQNLSSQADNVNGIVRAGYAQGLTGREMRGQISNLFDGMLMRHAEAIARTGYNHFSAIGRRAFADANNDIIALEVPITAMDSRVSNICLSIAARYGQRGWPIGENPIGNPPFHVNCRTTLAYLADGQRLVGTRAAVGDEAGQISASTTINQFVREQSDEWQDRLLGKRRAELFRQGKLSLKNLTDANLQPLTLDELLD